MQEAVGVTAVFTAEVTRNCNNWLNLAYCITPLHIIMIVVIGVLAYAVFR